MTIVIPDRLIALFEESSFSPSISIADADSMYWVSLTMVQQAPGAATIVGVFNQSSNDRIYQSRPHQCVTWPDGDARLIVELIEWLQSLTALRKLELR